MAASAHASPWRARQASTSPAPSARARLRLADIDGSGTTDIIYLHRKGVRLYFNDSGNARSCPRQLPAFPGLDDPASVVPVDLLGNGTVCLAWSSPLPGATGRPLRYVDLTGGIKPHLLTGWRNNLGSEMRLEYAPSTRFYLQDRHDDRPWLTPLPFPVHVLARVETIDHVSRTRFVSRYAYHHGHYDSEEREFRGFGMVEQWDSERYATADEGAAVDDAGSGAANADRAYTVPAVHTRTWYHTGIHLAGGALTDRFAGLGPCAGRGEYFREPGLGDAEARALLLPDTVLPSGLSWDEEREAGRALKGTMLRQEVYGEAAEAACDALPAPVPYSVAERNFTVRLLQPRGANRHAVFLTHAHESISYQYECEAHDPRIEHVLTLEVDDHGNVLKEAAIAYGRRTLVRGPDAGGKPGLRPNPALAALHPADQAVQTTDLLAYSENRVTNAIDEPHAYRHPMPCETRSYQLGGLRPTGPAGRYRACDLVEAAPGKRSAPVPAARARTRHARRGKLHAAA
ncbi:toxin TcdB middle/C-terminal domain-containing protein [Massilia sp. Se16.2.3]|uniref:toxin TcdB middle/C-terminal domain-containing protein n=1 Tax=Massilia sp. Se16.2.3 TaxID=2709303 RepID=UPI001603EC5C|nr:toxin TcdB middle/C-terminal domain-containing protein [Massilia sp. Se16.2.3]QNB00103.1 hypothetical protein G4G31_16910 [Massilia sp. Se16.2.3]